MSKILYGVCGIGNGHFYRQKPIIDLLLKEGHQLLFFAYGESYNKLIHLVDPATVILVDVPYLPGNNDGLDFKSAIACNKNYNIERNLNAFAVTQQLIGRPDLVISDYEPLSAQYGYAYDAPILTIDQQSKFLTHCTPPELNGFNSIDEQMRLRMFFPKANRVACSFFKLPQNKTDVLIVPPVYRNEILNIKSTPISKTYLIYLSAQNGFNQSLDSIVSILLKRPETFHIFTKDPYPNTNNIQIHPYNDADFVSLLATTSGVISTAGHNLLSECMYLNIPVYSMPLSLYEQQLNSYIIGKNHFGISHPILETDTLEVFTNNIEQYRHNIRNSDLLFKAENGLITINKTIHGMLNA